MFEGKPIAQLTLALEPGTLWARVMERTDHALRCGALQSIPTEYEFVEQGGISFLVRILSNLARKDEAKKKQDKENATSPKEFNPFLPYDEDLFVADISDTHLCLLNKFNVVDHHLIIVTRTFEEQETWLTLRDFEAMWACLAEFEGLAFYNAGKTAGASQRHKHLQIIPLSLAPRGPKIPIEPVLPSVRFQGSVGTIPSFPFMHAIAQLDPCWAKSPLEAAKATLKCYRTLLRAVDLPYARVSGNKQSGAYNLLATRQWMLIVPRSQACFQSISVNSLGFAGALLVGNEQQMKILKDHGPMTVLRSVAQSQ
ncbi:MAG: phosphorylase [Xenococcaceae cyanobacterium]